VFEGYVCFGQVYEGEMWLVEAIDVVGRRMVCCDLLSCRWVNMGV